MRIDEQATEAARQRQREGVRRISHAFGFGEPSEVPAPGKIPNQTGRGLDRSLTRLVVPKIVRRRKERAAKLARRKNRVTRA